MSSSTTATQTLLWRWACVNEWPLSYRLCYCSVFIRRRRVERRHKMKLGLDIDQTITSYPELFRFMAQAWIAAGGEVHFVTARPETERPRTVRELFALGFAFAIKDGAHARAANLHMFPDFYLWPYESEEHATRIREEAAQWKATTCSLLELTILFDDCPHNILRCQETPTLAVHVAQKNTM